MIFTKEINFKLEEMFKDILFTYNKHNLSVAINNFDFNNFQLTFVFFNNNNNKKLIVRKIGLK